ncbi:hypothetical protein AAZV13_18G058100 [Glycine max]
MGNLLTKLSANYLFCLSFLQAACFALALGFCGSANLQLGPYCSRLIKINSMLVQSMKEEKGLLSGKRTHYSLMQHCTGILSHSKSCAHMLHTFSFYYDLIICIICLF